MTQPGHKVRLSFQLKVLLPVLAALVLLPALTLWIVNGYISRQMEDEARQSLQTAEAVFAARTRATSAGVTNEAVLPKLLRTNEAMLAIH